MTGAVIEVVGGCVVLFLFGVRLISSEHFAEHETVELHVGAHDTQQFVGRNLFEHLFVVFLLDTLLLGLQVVDFVKGVAAVRVGEVAFAGLLEYSVNLEIGFAQLVLHLVQQRAHIVGLDHGELGVTGDKFVFCFHISPGGEGRAVVALLAHVLAVILPRAGLALVVLILCAGGERQEEQGGEGKK